MFVFLGFSRVGRWWPKEVSFVRDYTRLFIVRIRRCVFFVLSCKFASSDVRGPFVMLIRWRICFVISERVFCRAVMWNLFREDVFIGWW